YWKNDKGEILKSIDHLNHYVQAKNKKLVFAMNGYVVKKLRMIIVSLPIGQILRSKTYTCTGKTTKEKY
ncbi:hypothetical protein BOQ60_25370, partial [Chryseobacterium sp. CH1]